MNLNDQLQHHQPTATNIDDHGDQGLVCWLCLDDHQTRSIYKLEVGFDVSA